MKTPQQLFQEQQEMANKVGIQAEGADLVKPPVGVVLILHAGAACRRLQDTQPLPADAIAWTWQGAPQWYLPHQWPHGQLTQEDEAEAREVARQILRERGNFDERGRVDKLPQRSITLRPRLASEPTDLPPGFTTQPGAQSEKGEGHGTKE